MCDKLVKKVKVHIAKYEKYKYMLHYIPAMTLILCLMAAILIVTHDIKDDSNKAETIENKNIIRQIAYNPNTGIYPDKGNNIYRQVDSMLQELSDTFKIDIRRVRVLYRMANFNPVYTDKSPNIYTDLSINDLTDGSVYTVESYYESVKQEDNSGKQQEPSNKRLADAAYSVVKAFDAFQLQNATNNDSYLNDIKIKYLVEDDKAYVKFALDVLDFFGKSQYKDKFCEDYKNLIDMLQTGNIKAKAIYVDNNRKAQINSIILDNVLADNSDKEYIDLLADVLSGNNQFITETSFVKNYEIPQFAYGFQYLKTTRENMMIASTSLVGKVRYVWAGGHGGGAQIAGINPMWEKFNEAYKIKGISGCIQSSSGSCPVHGGGGCAYSAPNVSTIDNYVNTWTKRMNNLGLGQLTEDVDMDTMYSVFRDRNTVSRYGSQSLSIHTLDGLDCSGFACWLYNQIDPYTIKDTTAIDFVNSDGVKRVKYGDKLLPGDAIGWDTHIITVFGVYKDNAYIAIEQTPNVLRFSAFSVGGSKYLQEASDYAEELNAIAGVTSENAVKRDLSSYTGRGLGISRLNRPFDDEGVKIKKYGKSFEELNAREIVEVIGYGQQ